MNRMIYKIAQNSPTKYADQITNFIPIGIKAVIQKVKLMQKMEKYYPKELKRYEEVFGSDVWRKQMERYDESIKEVEEVDD